MYDKIGARTIPTVECYVESFDMGNFLSMNSVDLWSNGQMTVAHISINQKWNSAFICQRWFAFFH